MSSEVLTDKLYRSYNYISRYASFPTYYHNLDNKKIYGTTGQLSKDVQYVIHKVEKGDNFDSLSLLYYNSPLYFWIIADYNDIQDTLEEIAEGTLLRIPTLSSIVYEDV